MTLGLNLYSGCQKNVRYSNVFFYNHLCRNSAFRNIILKSGINHQTQLVKSEKMALGEGTKKKALFTEERLQAPRYNFAD